MLYRIIIEPEALQNLMNIKLYITRNDTSVKANKFISELKKSINSLAQMPQRCRKSYYTDVTNSHDLIYKKYTTVYKIQNGTVYVVSIFKQREN